MTIRLHLGGSRHGQLLDVQTSNDVIEYAVAEPVSPADWAEGQWYDPANIRLRRESYRRELIGLFGRRLYVMVLMGIGAYESDHLGFEFLASSLARVLVED